MAGARSQHTTRSKLCLGVYEQANTETGLKHRVWLENPFACSLVRPFTEEKRLWLEQGPNIDPVHNCAQVFVKKGTQRLD